MNLWSGKKIQQETLTATTIKIFRPQKRTYNNYKKGADAISSLLN